jgi:hypothetical protein
MTSRKHMQETLEQYIIPNFVIFVKKNHDKVEEKVLRGEFFTLFRRYLPELTNQKSSYRISLSNINYIGVSKDGNIISVSFSSSIHDRHSRIGEVVDMLNAILDSTSFDHSPEIVAFKLDRLMDSIRYINS